jgi:outer membrane protein assembly factor BamB
MAAAAAMVVAITLGVSLYHSDNGRPIIHVPQNGIYRGGDIKLTTPSDLSQAPNQLTWEAVPGASSYSVEVDDVTGDKIWESKSNENSIKVDPGVKAKMVPGKPLKWTVTAVDGNGKAFATGNGNLRVAVNR